MLDGEHLKILNKRKADLFRDFRALGKEEVQRLMSLAYLLELRAYAIARKDDKALALYRRQRSYFLVWRQENRVQGQTQRGAPGFPSGARGNLIPLQRKRGSGADGAGQGFDAVSAEAGE